MSDFLSSVAEEEIVAAFDRTVGVEMASGEGASPQNSVMLVANMSDWFFGS